MILGDGGTALYLNGNAQVAIVRVFQNLNVNKSVVSGIITCYRNTGGIAREMCNKTRNSSESQDANRTKSGSQW